MHAAQQSHQALSQDDGLCSATEHLLHHCHAHLFLILHAQKGPRPGERTQRSQAGGCFWRLAQRGLCGIPCNWHVHTQIYKLQILSYTSLQQQRAFGLATHHWHHLSLLGLARGAGGGQRHPAQGIPFLVSPGWRCVSAS